MPEKEYPDRIYNISEAARRMGVSRPTVYNRMKAGRLTHVVRQPPFWGTYIKERWIQEFEIAEGLRPAPERGELPGRPLTRPHRREKKITLKTMYTLPQAGVRLRHGAYANVPGEKGHSRSYMYTLINSGELVSKKIGGRRYISEFAIRAYEKRYYRTDLHSWEHRAPKHAPDGHQPPANLLYFKAFD